MFFKKHHPNFSTESTCNMSEVFWHMAESAELLSLAIYEIKEVWDGPGELCQANYALKALPKGLKFLRATPPLESLKVMGLMGIHDPDALCHLSGLTHCLWCRKVGQNEGTVINHFCTMHYRLGLVCNKCYNYPLTSSDILHHHSQQNCQPSAEGGPNNANSSE